MSSRQPDIMPRWFSPTGRGVAPVLALAAAVLVGTLTAQAARADEIAFEHTAGGALSATAARLDDRQTPWTLLLQNPITGRLGEGSGNLAMNERIGRDNITGHVTLSGNQWLIFDYLAWEASPQWLLFGGLEGRRAPRVSPLAPPPRVSGFTLPPATSIDEGAPALGGPGGEGTTFVVPEPGSMLLVAMGAMLMGARRGRRRRGAPGKPA